MLARTVRPLPSTTLWPPSGLSEVLPVVPRSPAAAPLRATRFGPLVLVRPRTWPSALRPGVLVAITAGATAALGLPGAGWVMALPWAWAWRGVGLPCPRAAVWVPLPRRGVRRVLWRLLAQAAAAQGGSFASFSPAGATLAPPAITCRA